jgi:hypothetical protein
MNTQKTFKKNMKKVLSCVLAMTVLVSVLVPSALVASALDVTFTGQDSNTTSAIKVNGVEATVAEKLAEVTIDGTHVLVGADIQGDVKDPETGAISKDTVYGANTTLASVLQGIQDSVSAAVSGGLTSVVAGNGIAVSAVASNKQTVSVKVSSAAGNMITADENGIYAAMYYDGDDTNDAE